MTKFVDVINFIIFYSLTIFYSTWVCLGYGFYYVFKRHTKFWQFKRRPNKPALLESKEYGEHKFAHVNGIKMHYVEKGDPKNPLIIFVHGFPEFWFSWRHQIKEFSRDYWTITIDQRGYNESDKPTKISDYHIDKMTDDINALVKKLGREKFILVAHDWGAVVGFHYVYRYMDTLEKYVLIGGPPVVVLKRLVRSSLKQFFMSWYIFLFQMPYLAEFLIGNYDFKVFNVMKAGSPEDVECYKYVFSQPGALTPPINYYRAPRILNPDPDLPRPKKFVPGLYMLGEYERYISRQTGEMAMEYYDKLEFKLIKGANHFAQQHKPDETNRMIREFLEKK